MTVERAPAQQASGVTQRASRSRLDLYPYWLVAPSLVAIGAIILYPIAQAILLSFQEGNLLKGGMVEPRPFVGLRNYATALGLPEFWRSLWVTVLYSLLSVAASYGIGLFMALLLTSAFRGRAVARVLAIAPWAMPPVVTSIVWLWMYDPQFGVINYLLQRAGLIATNLAWLADPLLALPAVIAVTVWKHVPLAMMVLLAGLQSIPQELYEAARIDGARLGRRVPPRHAAGPPAGQRRHRADAEPLDLQGVHLRLRPDRRRPRPGDRDARLASLRSGVQVPRLRPGRRHRRAGDADVLRLRRRLPAGRLREGSRWPLASDRARGRRAGPAGRDPGQPAHGLLPAGDRHHPGQPVPLLLDGRHLAQVVGRHLHLPADLPAAAARHDRLSRGLREEPARPVARQQRRRSACRRPCWR